MSGYPTGDLSALEFRRIVIEDALIYCKKEEVAPLIIEAIRKAFPPNVATTIQREIGAAP